MISSPKQLANNIKQMYFGGNWTEVNLKDTISNIPLEIAAKKIEGFNTILALTYHIHYFTKVQLKVLEDGILNGKDSESYKHPKISSQTEWKAMQTKMWQEAERFTKLVAQLSSNTLDQPFVDKKYGTYKSNFLGLIEHTHYHLGQITLLKKLF